MMPCTRVEIYRCFGETCKFYFRYNSKPLVEAAGSSDISVTFLRLYCVMSDSTVTFIAKVVSVVILTFTFLLTSRKIIQNCRDPTRPNGPSIYVADDKYRWQKYGKRNRDLYGCQFYAVPPTFFFQTHWQYAETNLQLAKTNLELRLYSIPVGARFFAPVQTGRGAHSASCTMGTGSFTGGKERQGLDADPSPRLVPWSRKSTAILLLPYGPCGLYRASVIVQGCTLPLPFFYIL